MSLLSANNLFHAYRNYSLVGASRSQPVLNGVSLDIKAGETVALLGRSGCGKSTLARILVGLERPEAGFVRFNGQLLREFSKAGWLDFRRAVQMVFQDPIGAVNPRARVDEIISEPLRHLCGLDQDQRQSRVYELLHSVDLHHRDAQKYAHQLSGGQLQRVCIARALAPNPKLIILDEAVSNLDLHLQAQVLELFRNLGGEGKVSYLFVTHDLRLVERFCTRVLVMDKGLIVEEASVSGRLNLTSEAGRTLQDAVLPAWPAQRKVAAGR